MRRAAVVLAAVACVGCQSGSTETPGSTGVPHALEGLIHVAWASSDSTGPPGVMRVFLGDGTLVMDSCWETYQLTKWRAESDSLVVWEEGSAQVRARVMELSAQTLSLRVELAAGTHDEHYRAASVPYLCPDLPR